MNILRLLLLVAAAWLIWRIVRRGRAQLEQRRKPADEFEPMARCAQCGTFLPARSLDAAGKCGRCG